MSNEDSCCARYVEALVQLARIRKPPTDSAILIEMMRNYSREQLGQEADKRIARLERVEP